MPVAAAIGAAGALGSAALQYFGSKNAVSAQTSATQQSMAMQQGMFSQIMQTLAPIIGQGKNILGQVTGAPLSTLTQLLTPGPGMTETLSQIPGFKFAQDWGQKAVANLGTTTGLGGNVLKAGADYATGVAQQGYGNIVNSLISAITGVGGLGAGLETGAAGALTNAATGTGKSLGETAVGLGQAQAGGALGQANALAGGLTGSANSAITAMMLSKILGGNSGAGSNAPSMY